MSFQAGYQYSDVPPANDPLSAPDQNLPAQLQAPSSIDQNLQQNQNPQQHQQHHPHPHQQQQQQDPYRARPYNASFHEYPQMNNAWNSVGGNVPAWLKSNSQEKRKRYIIGAVFIFFLFVISHHNGSKTTVPGVQTNSNNVVNSSGDIVTENNDLYYSGSVDNSSTSSSTKGVAGDNGTTEWSTGSTDVVYPSDEKSDAYDNIVDTNVNDNTEISNVNDNTESSNVDDNTESSNVDDDTESSHVDDNTESSNVDDNASTTVNSTEIKPLEQAAELTYLLTYPMSGVSYTTELIQLTTGMNTATNHERVFQRLNNHGPPPTQPIPAPSPAQATHTHSTETSPFWQSSNTSLTLPTRHILTQAHCDGFRSDSAVLPDWTFEQGCRTVRNHDGSILGVTPRQSWDPEKRLIHLVRDPFSNVVSRFHAWRWEQEGVMAVRNFLFHEKADEDKSRFREYCKAMNDSGDMDKSGYVSKDDVELREILKDIPCGLEFLKYFGWHALAEKMKYSSGTVMFGGISNPSETSLTIYYEDFASDVKANCALSMIAGFLNLDKIDLTQRPKYHGGRTYRGYFEEKEIIAVGKLVEIMLAHDSGTWDILKRYF